MSAQNEIAQTELSGSAGNGLVTVTGTGAGGVTESNRQSALRGGVDLDSGRIHGESHGA